MASKNPVQLNSNELRQIRSFYEQEKFQLIAKLQHVEEVLARLDGGRNEISDGAAPPVLEEVPLAKLRPGRPKKQPTVGEVKVKKAGRPKKRGPKSVWGNFIMRRLRQCDRPLSYAELVRDAMVMKNLPASKEKNAKASILNAAFRLRTHLNKVDTVGLSGKKEKFLVLCSWLDADGKLKAPYDAVFANLANTPMEDRGRKPRRPSGETATETTPKVSPPPAAAKPARKKALAKKAAAMPEAQVEMA